MSGSGYRVLFMTLSDGSRGFWIRYTRLWSDLKDKGGLWLTIFHDGPQGLHLNVKNINFGFAGGYVVRGTNLYFSSIESRSIFNGDLFGWRLNFEGQPPYNSVPPLIRLFRRRSRYIMVHPHAIFNGEVWFKERQYNILNVPGMIGYITSDRYLHHWVWVHCSGFEEYSDAWLDLLIASPDGGKEILFGALKYGGRVFRIGGLSGSKFDGEYGLGYLRGNIGYKAGAMDISFNTDKRNIIIAKYEDPVEGFRYCHNTEVADANIVIKMKGGEERWLSCIGRAFMEIVVPEILDESLTMVTEV